MTCRLGVTATARWVATGGAQLGVMEGKVKGFAETGMTRDGSLMRFQTADNAISHISIVMQYKTLKNLRKTQNMRFRINRIKLPSHDL